MIPSRPGKAVAWVAAIIVGVALVALAGCGGSSSSSTTASASIQGVGAANCADVQYGGSGNPDALIVSDLPMQGDSAERSKQQVDAIRLVLEQNGWKAGDTTVGFQACDDSIAKTGLWDAATCRANAHAYADDPRVLGVVGTYNSGCAAEEIPILNKSGVAMISPGNTAVCLTEKSPLCEDGQPNSLYPSGNRNYARVVPNDAFQGAADAEFAQKQGVQRPYILYAADDPTSTGQGANFRGGAEAVGLKVAGSAAWDPKAKSYTDLMNKVKQSGADGVVLAGLIDENGGPLIKDKVATLGSNQRIPLIAFDGFAQQSTIDQAGSASAGMFASIPGRAPEALTKDGATLVESLKKDAGNQPIEQFAPYAGEAAKVLLDAIGQAGQHRAGVVDAVFKTKGGGILGAYRLTPNGDPTVGPITILKASSSFQPVQEIRPDPRVVTAARLSAKP